MKAARATPLLKEVRRTTRSWLREYNEIRPHRSLSNKTQQTFALSARSVLISISHNSRWTEMWGRPINDGDTVTGII